MEVPGKTVESSYSNAAQGVEATLWHDESVHTDLAKSNTVVRIATATESATRVAHCVTQKTGVGLLLEAAALKSHAWILKYLLTSTSRDTVTFQGTVVLLTSRRIHFASVGKRQ